MQNLLITKIVSCLMFIAVIFPSSLAAQWSGSSLSGDTYRTGNVGIGQTSPTTLLHIKTEDLGVFGGGLYRAPNIRLEYQTNNNNNYVGNDFWDITSGSSLDFSYGTSTANMVNQMSISSNILHFKGNNLRSGEGENEYNLGVGTSPSGNAGHYLSFGANYDINLNRWNFTGNSSNNGGSIITGDDQGNLFFITRSTDGSNIMTAAQTATNVKFFIRSDENIGAGFNVSNGKVALCENGVLIIGENSTSTDNTIADIAEIEVGELEYHLYVEKGIRTERARVDLKSTWADYIFAETYDLPKLTEVEQFITANKHLPNVPSAAEVKANGIDVAEMDETLLRKIEELTLYTIEQQKTIDATNKELATLKAQMTAIQAALEKSK